MIIDSHTKILLTGATSKLGQAIALSCLKKGAKVFLSGKNENQLLKLKTEVFKDFQVEIFTCDLSCKKKRSDLIEWMHLSDIDLLINNAGLGLYGPAVKHKVEENLHIIDVNVNALVDLTLSYVKDRIHQQKKGLVLNISSATDTLIFPNFSVYSASKAFVTSFSKSLNYELSNSGIKILTASPGQIETDFKIKASKGFYSKAHKNALSPKKAAKYLIKQIYEERSYLCFPLKVKISRWFLSFILCEKVMAKLLAYRLQRRYK